MQRETPQPIRDLKSYVLFSTGNLHASQLCVTEIEQCHSPLRTSSRLVHRFLICHCGGQCEQESACTIEIESLTQSCTINRLLTDCVHTSFIVLYLLAEVFYLDDDSKNLQVLSNLVANPAGNILNLHPVDLTFSCLPLCNMTVLRVESGVADVREHQP